MFNNNRTTLAKNLMSEILYILPRQVAHTLLYYYYHRQFPNFNEPVLYDEKIHWLMINVYDESYGKYADKYEVRKYVKKCGLETLLIPVYEVYEHTEEIDYDTLPNEFILMATHGSGDNFYAICEDKSRFDFLEANRKLSQALRTRYAKMDCEYQYADIKPRIICEKLLKDKENSRLTDYKVICVNGKPTRILVCTNRNQGRDYYNLEWEYIEHVKPEYRSGKLEKKPSNLDEMLFAEVLAKPFPLARIDFYIAENKLYFGEITLTPCAGNHPNLSEEGQVSLGREIRLPINRTKSRRSNCNGWDFNYGRPFANRDK